MAPASAIRMRRFRRALPGMSGSARRLRFLIARGCTLRGRPERRHRRGRRLVSIEALRDGPVALRRRHVCDPPHWALQLKYPSTCECLETEGQTPDSWGSINRLVYEYPRPGAPHGEVLLVRRLTAEPERQGLSRLDPTVRPWPMRCKRSSARPARAAGRSSWAGHPIQTLSECGCELFGGVHIYCAGSHCFFS